MRINIITGSKEYFNRAIPYATCAATALADHYTPILQDACAKQIDTQYRRGLPLQEKNSDNFQAMGNMERAIFDFLKEHTFPKNVEIITDCDEASTMYKVVYNFWFAQEKSARMEDDSWD